MKRLVMVSLLALTLSASMSAFAEGPRLVLDATSNFKLMWNDGGSGADRDGAFYRTQPPSGFFSVGDYGQNNYGEPSGIVIVVRAINDDPRNPLLTPPVDYIRIWTDRGSGADRDGSFWQPVPLNGYVCIGSVVQRGYAKPDVPNYRCIRGDHVEHADIRDLIWTDRGSGADQDVAVYALDGTNVIYAQGNYNEPSHRHWRPIE